MSSSTTIILPYLFTTFVTPSIIEFAKPLFLEISMILILLKPLKVFIYSRTSLTPFLSSSFLYPSAKTIKSLCKASSLFFKASTTRSKTPSRL